MDVTGNECVRSLAEFLHKRKKKLYLLAGGQDFLGMDTGIRTFG